MTTFTNIPKQSKKCCEKRNGDDFPQGLPQEFGFARRER